MGRGFCGVTLKAVTTLKSKLAPLGLDVVHNLLEALQPCQLQAGAILQKHNHVCRGRRGVQQTPSWLGSHTEPARSFPVVRRPAAGGTWKDQHAPAKCRKWCYSTDPCPGGTGVLTAPEAKGARRRTNFLDLVVADLQGREHASRLLVIAAAVATHCGHIGSPRQVQHAACIRSNRSLPAPPASAAGCWWSQPAACW